jgi:hypothetical protein
MKKRTALSVGFSSIIPPTRHAPRLRTLDSPTSHTNARSPTTITFYHPHLLHSNASIPYRIEGSARRYFTLGSDSFVSACFAAASSATHAQKKKGKRSGEIFEHGCMEGYLHGAASGI